MNPPPATQYGYPSTSTAFVMAEHTTTSSNSMLSPFKQKRAYTAPPQLGLKQERNNMIWDLDEVLPEIDRSFFKTHLLPPSPLPADVSVHSIVRKLRDLGKINLEGRWRGWTQPTDNIAKEDDVFGRFESLVATILEAYAPPGKPRTIEFKCNPAFSLWSHMRTNTSKPDCYGIRVNAKLVHDEGTRKKQPQWVDVAVPGEFKKKDSVADFNDVRTCSLLTLSILSLSVDV